jgi:hypothetical protein
MQNCFLAGMDNSMVVVLIIGVVFIVSIVFKTIGSVIKSLARERTRREIAAYIAEGSMTPDQGESLMAAGEPKAPSWS